MFYFHYEYIYMNIYLSPSHSFILNLHILVYHYIYNYIAVSFFVSLSLTGLLTFPVPSNVKAENFTLINKTSIVNNVTPFNKSEKLQLEHIFLKTLCKSGLTQLVTNKGRRRMLKHCMGGYDPWDVWVWSLPCVGTIPRHAWVWSLGMCAYDPYHVCDPWVHSGFYKIQLLTSMSVKLTILNNIHVDS